MSETIKDEPSRAMVTLFFELELDGRLTVCTCEISNAHGVPDLRLSGEPAAIFRDLGPEIARRMLAKKMPPQFETELAKWMKGEEKKVVFGTMKGMFSPEDEKALLDAIVGQGLLNG
jgi:hypothetical protein